MEMKIKIDGPVIVDEDILSAIAVAKNEGHQNRAKHIDIRYHFLRDLVKAKNVHLEYIWYQIVHVSFSKAMNMLDIYSANPFPKGDCNINAVEELCSFSHRKTFETS